MHIDYTLKTKPKMYLMYYLVEYVKQIIFNVQCFKKINNCNTAFIVGFFLICRKILKFLQLNFKIADNQKELINKYYSEHSKTVNYLKTQCNRMLYYNYTCRHTEVVRCIYLSLKYIICMYYHACAHILFKR
ncbi:hypothetical protein PAEPH01_2797 [Pancytospora epiphaga]|nr:hypothetical protein PAEPH01_2797 [Pancytospora epiphaga]